MVDQQQYVPVITLAARFFLTAGPGWHRCQHASMSYLI
jgi:hypothetical protein